MFSLCCFFVGENWKDGKCLVGWNWFAQILKFSLDRSQLCTIARGHGIKPRETLMLARVNCKSLFCCNNLLLLVRD